LPAAAGGRGSHQPLAGRAKEQMQKPSLIRKFCFIVEAELEKQIRFLAVVFFKFSAFIFSTFISSA